MEDTFRVRVDRAFGSLASSSSSAAPSSSLSSLWCLTDDEIERKEWNRDKGSHEPEPDLCSSNMGPFPNSREKSGMDFRLEMEKDLHELGDVDDDDLDGEEPRDSRALLSQSAQQKPVDYKDEEWEIKNSIGLDYTLDYEEEEDKYDKVAVGKEKAGDRLYMRDINCDVERDSSNALPNSFEDVTRDPRANHIAAKIRLKEDAEAARKMDSLQVTEKDSPAIAHNLSSTCEDHNLKSILKRKDDDTESKSENTKLDSKLQKRVRFDDPECKDGRDVESAGVEDMQMETDSTEEALVYHLPPDYPSGIPDYMRNPSKYTRYTFDDGDVDEESNRLAYMDFLKMVKRNTTEAQPENASVELPKSLTFIPKRKTSDAIPTDGCIDLKQNQDAVKESVVGRSLPQGIAIAANDSENGEICCMEEDESEAVAESRDREQRKGRQYRTKAKLETNEPI